MVDPSPEAGRGDCGLGYAQQAPSSDFSPYLYCDSAYLPALHRDEPWWEIQARVRAFIISTLSLSPHI